MQEQKKEVLITAYSYVERLIDGINDCVNDLQGGNEKKGYEIIPQIAEGIEYIIDVVKVTNNLDGKLNNIDSIIIYLNEIVDALNNGDFILVGDIFYHEIIPILKSVRGNIEEMLK